VANPETPTANFLFSIRKKGGTVKAYAERVTVVVSGGSLHVIHRKKCDYYNLRKYTRIFRVLKKFKTSRRKNHNG
jgi:hypothetical protein